MLTKMSTVSARALTVGPSASSMSDRVSARDDARFSHRLISGVVPS
jgi:hypothetical protein